MDSFWGSMYVCLYVGMHVRMYSSFGIERIVKRYLCSIAFLGVRMVIILFCKIKLWYGAWLHGMDLFL